MGKSLPMTTTGSLSCDFVVHVVGQPTLAVPPPLLVGPSPPPRASAPPPRVRARRPAPFRAHPLRLMFYPRHLHLQGTRKWMPSASSPKTSPDPLHLPDGFAFLVNGRVAVRGAPDLRVHHCVPSARSLFPARRLHMPRRRRYAPEQRASRWSSGSFSERR